MAIDAEVPTRYSESSEGIEFFVNEALMKKIHGFQPITEKSEIDEGSYTDVVKLLRKHMAAINKLNDAPDVPSASEKSRM